MAEDLWGDIPDPANILTPESILVEQADILTKKTKGILTGLVTKQIQSNNNLNMTVSIVAPALNNNNQAIVTISHQIGMYPIILLNHTRNIGGMVCKDEDALLQALKEVFTSEPGVRIITGLLARVRAETPQS